MRDSDNNRPVIMSVAQYQDRLLDGSMSMPEIVAKVRENGLDGVEMRRDKWPNYREHLAETRDALDAAGGMLVTFASFTSFFNESEEGNEELLDDLRTAKLLGAVQMRVFQGPTPEADSGPQWDNARRLIDHAWKEGVPLVLENTSHDAGGRLAEINRILDVMDVPELRTNIDIGNYAWQGDDVVEAVKTLGSRAVSSHLKDAGEDRSPTFLTDGVLPLDEIFDLFAELPQRIIHCFEFGGRDNPEERIRISLDYLRSRKGRI